MNGKSFLFERWPRIAYRHARLVLAGTFAVMALLAVAWTFGRGEYGKDSSGASAG